MASTSETGLQLFARLVARPSLVGLEDTLFPQGPGPKEVVEVGGDPACGKTLLFTQFVASCILPKEWQGVSMGGFKSGVVLLNTDHHFHIYKLISIMESRLKAATDNFSVAEVENIIKDSLARLTVYNITDSHQLQVTLFALQSVIATQADIGLILLDSVCAFYWLDSISSGIRKMDLYAKNVLKNIQKTLVDFKGVIMYTRPSYFQSKGSKVDCCKVEPDLGCINRRIILKPNPLVANGFLATVENPSGQFHKPYTIGSSGLIWT